MDDQTSNSEQDPEKIETKKFNGDSPETERVTASDGNTPLSPDAPTADIVWSDDEIDEYTSEVPTMAFETPIEVEPLIRYGDVLLSDFTTLNLKIGDGANAATIETPIKDMLIIGRAVENDPDAPAINLAPYNAYERGVSRQHVKIIRQVDTLYVVDLGSRNGTYLNGIRLHPNQARVLRDNDELMLGRLPITVKLIGVESLDD